MSTIFRTSINYRETPPQMQEFTEPSQTQPDEVMSIREMLTRHVRGLPVPTAREEGNYYPEELGYIPSFEELDLSEIGDYREFYDSLVERLTDEQNEEPSPNVKGSAEGDKPQKSDGKVDSDSDVEPSAEA